MSWQKSSYSLSSDLLCNASGHVDSEELRRVLTECGRMKLTKEEADEFIDALHCPTSSSSQWSDHFFKTGMVDADGDGMLDYSEFVQLFTDKLGLPWNSQTVKYKNFIMLTKKFHNFRKWHYWQWKLCTAKETCEKYLNHKDSKEKCDWGILVPFFLETKAMQ